jgi:beta-N-acetylhexosaminidase
MDGPISRRGALLAGAGLAVAGLGLAGRDSLSAGRGPAARPSGGARAGHDAGAGQGAGSPDSARPGGAARGGSGARAGSDGSAGDDARAGSAGAAGKLTGRQQAGQRVICSYTGLTPPDSLLEQIRAGEAAGVIFITGNIASESQIASVIKQCARAAASSPVHAPLLLMTDQEGGEVRRLPGAPALSEKQVGEAADFTAAAAQAGTGAGRNLRGVGMTVDLAPVLGVYRAPGDFLDQFQRSYGMNAGQVARCGQSFIEAMRKTGTVPTAKHFPGLGAATASQNTDVEPVVLDVPLETLRAVDEHPYWSAMAAGVPMIMVSWATYPALDAKRPAGLSPAVVTGELRGYLGYQGVTITDALEAGALRGFGDTPRRAVQAARAGMDLLLCASGDPAQGQEAVNALVDGLSSGQLDRGEFTASVRRITALRESL